MSFYREAHRAERLCALIAAFDRRGVQRAYLARRALALAARGWKARGAEDPEASLDAEALQKTLLEVDRALGTTTRATWGLLEKLEAQGLGVADPEETKEVREALAALRGQLRAMETGTSSTQDRAKRTGLRVAMLAIFALVALFVVRSVLDKAPARQRPAAATLAPTADGAHYDRVVDAPGGWNEFRAAHSNGPLIRMNLTVSPGPYRLAVLLREDHCPGGSTDHAQVTVESGGAILTTWAVKTTWSERYTLPIQVPPGGGALVLRFINDRTGDGCDRNVHLDSHAIELL